LPRRSTVNSVVGWVTVGGSVAPTLLIILGVLVATKQGNALFSANPIGALASGLPTWFLVPYLIVGVGGLVAGAVLDLYSSGLNLLTFGVKLPRYQSVVIDGVVMVLGNIYILFIAKNFIAPFESFLIVLGIPLACWSAVFLVDFAMFHRRGYAVEDLYTLRGTYRYQNGINIRAVAAWLIGVIIGFGLYKSTVGWLTWLGWWAGSNSPFASSSLGLFVGFGVAAVLYFLFSLAVLGRAPAATEASASTP
jgi:nucleobase:cation symporter-1, NCS1 family